MKEYLDPIFNASNIDDVCRSLQIAIEKLRNRNLLKGLPENYDELSVQNPKDIQDWFDVMKDDDRATKEEGVLREVYGLFQAALKRLRDHGFHRNSQ